MDKPLVLLVDDNEATCTLVRALLRRDFDVELAGDGAEAIERLRTGRFAVVMLDLRMPNVDGFDVLAFLGEHRPDLIRRVLVFTAALSHPELGRVAAYDVAGVVSKPFEVDALLDAVRKCAGISGRAIPLLSSGVLLLLADLLRQRWG